MKATKIEKIYDNEIKVWFETKYGKGTFHYSFFTENSGINDCVYEESPDEDIYQEIHDWVSKHIKGGSLI